MKSYSKFYTDKLYPLQNGILKIVNSLHTPFYLTGGTALSRGYFNHRFSDELDFIVNQDNRFIDYIKQIITAIENAEKELNFRIQKDSLQISTDFAEFYLESNSTILKIDFVNDIKYRNGSILQNDISGKIDCIENILSNNIAALFRFEPKDIVDIWIIAKNQAFNWGLVLKQAKEKELGIDSLVIAEIIASFPTENLAFIKWEIDYNEQQIHSDLQIIAKDILEAKDNSFV